MIPARRLALAPWEVGAFLVAVGLGRVLALDAAAPGSSAWVDLRYAQNLAAGLGFVFSPGAAWEPTAGAAAPGLSALAAFLRDSAGGVLEAARYLGVAADLVTAGCLGLVLGARPLAARVCLALFALLPVFVLQPSRADSGSLALCFAVCAAAALRGGRLAWAGGWAGLGTALRPELGLLAPCLALFARGRWQLLLVLPTVVAALLFLVWIRTGFEPALWLAPLARLAADEVGALGRWSILAQDAMGGGLGLALAPAALYGFYRTMQVREAGVLSLVVGGFVLVVLGALSALEPGEGIVHVARGAWIACVGLGVEGLWRRWPKARLALAPCVLAGAALVGAALPPAADALPQQAEIMAWARRARAGNKSLYARDGAALAYLANLRVLGCDAGGLPLGDSAEQRRAALRQLRPDYLLLEVAREGLGIVYGDDVLARGYYPVRRFSASGEGELNPSLAGLPARAPGELLLLRRGEL